MAIICKCLTFNVLASGLLAVLLIADSTSYTLVVVFREIISPVGVMIWFGSRRKEERMRVGREVWIGIGDVFSGGGEEGGGEGEGDSLPIVNYMSEEIRISD